MSNVLRDFLVWQTFTPGVITTGGTVSGSIVNPMISISNLLSINTTSGNISFALPAVPTGFSAWACKLEATIEGISPTAIPNTIQPMYASLWLASSAGTILFNDSDWGNFIAYSGNNSTLFTKAHFACNPGTVVFQIDTSGIAIINSAQQSLNRKIHFAVDAVAY
jgi:hypothetical protein